MNHSTMANKEEFDVDAIIDRLLEVRGARPGKEVNLPEEQIKTLLSKATDIFMSQPMLLNLSAPIKVCGLFLLCVDYVQAIFTVSTTICFVSSNTAVSLRNRTTSLWGMWCGERAYV